MARSYDAKCPKCYRPLIQLISYLTNTYDTEFRCKNCAMRGESKYIWKLSELQGGEVKEIIVTKTYNDTIIDIKFVTYRSKDYFKNNVTPMVQVIKAMIPATSREWNQQANKWSIDMVYWPVLEQVFKQANFKITEVAEATTSTIPGVNVPKDYAENFHYESEVITQQESATSIASQLSEYLGVQIVAQDIADLKKLYRAKALELHPDRNPGNTEAATKMSELNRLWTLYCNTGVKQ